MLKKSQKLWDGIKEFFFTRCKKIIFCPQTVVGENPKELQINIEWPNEY